MTLLPDALELYHAGYTVIRVATDGTKQPLGKWKQYQTQRPTEEQVRAWFANGYPGIGIITGAASGNAEMLEFEGRTIREGIFAAWGDLMNASGLGHIKAKLVGYADWTPKGGIHFHYRVDGQAVPGNTKLARRPSNAEELAANPGDKVQTLIETRGEGGFVVTAPSNGTTHDTGKPWKRASGGPRTTPTLTADEHEALMTVCKALDQMPEPAVEPSPFTKSTRDSDSERPGDDYNRRARWEDILTGWTKVYTTGTVTHWRRPGKNIGTSATTGRNDADNLYVFSSSTEFDPEKPYSKFAAYTLLEHQGDYKAAAKQLRTDGYGENVIAISSTSTYTASLSPATTHEDEPNENDPNRYDDLYLPRSALVDLPRGEPLIDGVLDRHTLFVIAGRDRTYKSFLALDWLACLATGHPWLGRTTERTKVLYIVGEGAWGLNDRVAAWEAAWGHDIDDQWFHIRRAPVNLFRQTDAYLDMLDRIQNENYGVIVFDTLQRMSSGADQNSAKDAGVIIHALDRIRQITDNGAVGVVAHTDKGDNDTRGSSAFEDDADIVWRTKRDEDDQVVKLVLAKRKDGPDGLTFDLRPNLIEGTGSLVLEQAGALPPSLRQPPKHSFEVLKTLASSLFIDDGASLTALGETLGHAGKGSVQRAVTWLLDQDYVEKVRIPPRSQADLGRVGRYPRLKITSQGASQLEKVGEFDA